MKKYIFVVALTTLTLMAKGQNWQPQPWHKFLSEQRLTTSTTPAQEKSLIVSSYKANGEPLTASQPYYGAFYATHPFSFSTASPTDYLPYKKKKKKRYEYQPTQRDLYEQRQEEIERTRRGEDKSIFGDILSSIVDIILNK